MRNLLILFILALIVISLLILNYNNTQNLKNTLTIDNHTFLLDIAKTQSEQEIGLSKYNKLPNNMGMLFPFPNYDYYTFWMKNMKFPIDIIYIKDNKIVDVFVNVLNPKSDNEQLKIYKPRSKANFVLEINSNLSKKYNFKIGDLVKITL